MSLPLLNTSPTIALEVPTDDYKLRASAVRSPDSSNGLVIGDAGLYVKKAQRRYPWQIRAGLNFSSSGAALSSSTTANQVITWQIENYDPDGLVNLTSTPTRVTVPAAGRYWHAIMASWNPSQAAGGTQNAEMLLLKNGATEPVAVQVLTSGARTAGGISGSDSIAGSLSAWTDAAAGDYFEVYFRWIFQTTPIAGTLLYAQWGGGLLST